MRNLIILFLIFIIPSKALGLIEVDITRGNLNPLPIAVSPLSIDNESKKSFEKTLKKKDIGSEISKVIIRAKCNKHGFGGKAIIVDLHDAHAEVTQ